MLPIKTFILVCSDRFVERGGMVPIEALPYAEDRIKNFLLDENISYGDPGYDWDAFAAEELADDEMSCW